MKLKQRTQLNRRRFLRGAAGTVIGLPLLEYMLDSNGTAFADGSSLPCRYFLFFAPTSLVVSGSRTEGMTPTTTGPNYQITPALQPLVDRNVKDSVSVVSGLFCAPINVPGGYNADYHGQAYRAVLSGQRSGWATDGENWRPQGVSSDELCAQASPASLRFRKLYFQIDPVTSGSQISFERRESGGRVFYQNANPEVSPANAYRALFQDFVSPDAGPAEVASLDQRLRESSLSYASEQIRALEQRLSASDKRTLEEHLTHVRELERRITISTQVPTGAGCADPALSSNDPSDLGTGLPNQDARADLFAELIRMSFACDMTRVVTLAATSQFTGSGMRHDLWRSIGGHHGELQHSYAQAELDKANSWFVDVYARVLEKLKDTAGGAGSILDDTAAVFAMEGGKGLTNDSQRSGDGGGDPNHSCDNMLMMVGGRAGGLTPRGHVNLDGQDIHPAAVLNAAVRGAGVNQTLGEISNMVELF